MRYWILIPFCYSFCVKQGYDAYVNFKDKDHCACVDLLDKKDPPPIPFTLQWTPWAAHERE